MSDIKECAEVVEDKAVVFRKSDANDLQKKLQALTDDEKAVRKYKAEAADFICKKYSWDDVAKETEGLYEESVRTWRRCNYECGIK